MRRPNHCKPLVCITLLVGVVGLGLWLAFPALADVKGAKEGEAEKEFEHLHFPTPWPYLGKTPPRELWSDPQVLARGKQIYEQACAVCHGGDGDGHGPAGPSLRPPPPDFTEAGAIAEMGPDFWFWRVSEGGVAQPYKSLKSAMPPFKHLSEDDRWAVIAYQHTFSGHQGPHTQAEHPDVDRAEFHARMTYEMACTWCHGTRGRGDGSVAFSMNPSRAPRPRNFTQGEFKFRSTPTGQPPTDEDLFRTIMTGLTGTPMPSYYDAFEGQEEDVWHLVNFILSLSRE